MEGIVARVCGANQGGWTGASEGRARVSFDCQPASDQIQLVTPKGWDCLFSRGNGPVREVIVGLVAGWHWRHDDGSGECWNWQPIVP